MPPSRTGAPVICLYVFDEQAMRSNARRRSAARRAGGWRNRCGPCRKPRRDRRVRWCCAREPRPRSSPSWPARPTPVAVFWNEIAQAPHQAVAEQVASGAARARRRRATAFPAISWSHPSQIRNKEDRGLRVFTPFWRRVQALGEPPKPLPAPRKLHAWAEPCRRCARKLGPRADPVRTGPAACARPGRRAKHRPKSG